MGGKPSTQQSQRGRAYSNFGQPDSGPGESVTANGAELAVAGTSSGMYARERARSLGSAQYGGTVNQVDSPSESTTPDNTPGPLVLPLSYGRMMPSSWPVQLFSYHGK